MQEEKRPTESGDEADEVHSLDVGEAGIGDFELLRAWKGVRKMVRKVGKRSVLGTGTV